MVQRLDSIYQINMMNNLFAITVISVFAVAVGQINETGDASKHLVLSRQRRFLAFPRGSTFSVINWVNSCETSKNCIYCKFQSVICMTVGFHGNPQFDFISWAVNWGVAYELPNSTWVNHNLNAVELPRSIVQRRFRRDFFRNIEQTINTYVSFTKFG